MKDFVHLHVHSEYSLLDGACRVADLPTLAAEMGHSAVAITDHGVMYGAVAHYRACMAKGIKPIIGCEMYVAPRSRHLKEGREDVSGHHLILLVENDVGYRNLITMVSASFTQGFYQKPRIDTDLLAKHTEGLICLTACLAGAVPQRILMGDMDGAQKTAEDLAALFAPGHFFLELQDHGLPDDKTVVRGLLDIAEATHLPVVATNDVHYSRREDARLQALLMCIQMNRVVADGRPIGFETDEFYYKSTEEMNDLFGQIPGALENSVKIATMCHFTFSFDQVHLPVFPLKTGEDHRTLLEDAAHRGFSARRDAGLLDLVTHTEQEYLDRMKSELAVIDDMGFDSYYLVVRDFIMYAKNHGIPVGPGRGSGAGSLVAYFVGITDVDPLRYDLLFERFLNPERVSLPDFDTDFCYVRRDEVISYVKQKYGEDHVAQIVTFGTMAARAAVRDVGRAMGMTYAEVDRVAKLISRMPGVTLKTALESKELKLLYDQDETVRKLIDDASSLEGMPRHASTHAAGVVITEQPTDTYVPLAVNGDSVVTQYDMDTDAALGLVKFDFLGLRYLTVINDAVLAVKRSVPAFTVESLPDDDSAVYRLLSEAQTDGVFQLESPGMKQMLTQLRPERFEDIIAAIALFRPGPMESIPTYIACKHGKQKVEYKVPALRDILGVTYGCIVYQEQVMQIFRALAGYSYARADLVRRAMAKKKTEALAAELDAFLAGTAANGIDGDTARAIFDEMANFAKYAFNKSHATAYAVLSYRTAYLKAHYPCEYFSALMSSVVGYTGKINDYITECTRRHIRVLPPDIGESVLNFSVCAGHIRFGFLAVRGIGSALAERIIAERQNGVYRGFADFVSRMCGRDLTIRQLEALIKCGAFDSFGVYRSRLLAVAETVLAQTESLRRGQKSGQLDFFSSDVPAGAGDTVSIVYPDIPEFSTRELLIMEKESSGIYFSGHILDNYSQHIHSLSPDDISAILRSFEESPDMDAEDEPVPGVAVVGTTPVYHDKQTVTVAGMITRRVAKNTRGGAPMAFLTLEDRHGEVDIVVFPRMLEKYGGLLTVDTPLCVTGQLSVSERTGSHGESEESGTLSVSILLNRCEPLMDNQSVSGVPPEKEQATLSGRRLFLRVPSLEHPVARQALSICKAQTNGSLNVCFFSAETGKYAMAEHVLVSPDNHVLAELRRLLGEPNVVIR